VGVAEEHPQHSRAVTDSALCQASAGALDDVGAENRRRELTDGPDPDPSEVGLETAEMMAVLVDRRRAQPSLFVQVVEEPGNGLGEGWG